MKPGTLKVRECGRKVSMFNNGFEFAVEVGGKRIPEYGSKGRTFIEGRKGYRYELKFRNNRAERVLVVPTVDGLSVVDGKLHGPDSTGYVVQAYSSVTITGWRTSMAEVRGFEFSDKSGSYAGKTVEQRNCGVIGAAVYAEKKAQPSEIHVHHWYSLPTPPTPSYPPLYPTSTGTPLQATYTMRSASNSMDDVVGSVQMDCSLKGSLSADAPQSIMYMSTQNSAPDFNLGTAFGAPIKDNVTSATFERGMCLATFEIYYSDRDGLMKDGIQVDKAPELATFPQAFGGFCKPPA